jgi:hypothetical protein
MGPHEQLIPYLRAQEGIPFAWGAHDCLTFTNGAWRAMYGHGWADDWLGRYLLNGKPRCREAMILEFGFKTFEEAVDLRLQPAGKYPPRGALVTTTHARRWVTGVALGICVGTHCAFLTDKGLTYLPLEMIKNSWIEK